MREIWKPIPGYFDYEASSLGRIRRASGTSRFPPGHVLSGYAAGGSAGNRYRVVTLCVANHKLRRYVHRLVCLAFCGPAPTRDHEVAHRNGQRADNRERNLRWLTRAENHQEKNTHGTMARGEMIASAKITAEQAAMIRRLWSAGVIARGDIARWARENGLKSTLVRNVIHRRTWKHVA